MADVLGQIPSRLYEGDEEGVAALVKQALDQGLSPQEVLSGGLIAGMNRVGHDFRNGDLFVPEVLMAAEAMHAGMAVLKPLLVAGSVPTAGKLVIGTVEGDLHDIGKNLVKMMLEGAGFDVIDLGTDVRPDAFVAAVREHKPGLLGMSALLTTTMGGMQATIGALAEAGLRDSVKVMVGGAPVTEAYARRIGADAYSSDAGSAVEAARRLVA
jgi:5-methyltetrahydrofolate--homocysteine methyltransferase